MKKPKNQKKKKTQQKTKTKQSKKQTNKQNKTSQTLRFAVKNRNIIQDHFIVIYTKHVFSDSECYVSGKYF